MTELSPRDARRILRREILRRCWLPLLAVGLWVAVGLSSFAAGFPALTMTVNGLWDPKPVDGSLRLFLIVSALALSVALMWGEHSGLRPLLRRLPVAPTVALRVRLELALACGMVILAAVFMVEYFAAPSMLRPSFPSRLNPVESQTLSRLPGVPLLRFDVDGQVHRGLGSQGSMSRMHRNGLQSYGGYAGSWHYPPSDTLPKPGDVITRLDADTWSTFSGLEKQNLLRLGLPEGAEIDVALERYVSKEEYTSRPWRRDGLFRDRRWHALDRAVGFLALLVVSLSVSALATSLPSTLAVLYLVIVVPIGLFPGTLNGKPAVLMTDLDRSNLLTEQPTLPTLPIFHHPLEHWIWPGFLSLISLVIYVLAVRTLRHIFQGRTTFATGSLRARVLGPLSPTVRFGVLCGLLSPFIAFIMADFNTAVLAHGQTLKYLVCCVLIALAYLVKHRLPYRPWVTTAIIYLPAALILILWKDPLVLFRNISPQLQWHFMLSVVIFGSISMSMLWTRREPLLKRLPVEPITIANRRLGLMLPIYIMLALLPVALEVLPDRVYLANDSNFGGERFSADDVHFLELFGAVPLLRITSEESFEGFAQYFFWSPPNTRPFLPRGYVFRSHFEHFEPKGRISIQIGETIEGWQHSLEVVDLLSSREEVEEFLAAADFDQLGPVPGIWWPPHSLLILACGLGSLCITSLLSPRIALFVSIGVLSLLQFFWWDGYREQPPPDPTWWLVMTLIVIFLAAMAHTLMRWRLTVDVPLDVALDRWFSRRWRRLWPAIAARSHDIA